jgi:hypothetical protein
MNRMSQSIQPAFPQSGYTAAQLALALGLNKRSVLKALVQTPATGVAIIRGNDTPTWTLADLPDRLIDLLRYRAGKTGETLPQYIEGLVKLKAHGIALWQPKLALAEIAADCLADATKLRTALLPALQRHSSPLLSGEDRARLGLADYQRAFGHTINERHWRRLIARTLQRDGGAEDFNRLELYLPDNPKPKADPARLLPHEADFKELRTTIQSFKDPAKPSAAEKSALWAQAFEIYAASQKTGRKQLRRKLVKSLMRHAPWLAENEHALRVNFERKFNRWQKQGETPAALMDGRELKRGVPTAAPIPQDDRDRIVYTAAFECGGRVAQAKNQLVASGNRSGLSAGTLELLANPRTRKSAVPKRIMRAVLPDVKAVSPYLLGKKAIDDATAHLERDYSKLASMQVVTADDLTAPIYFYVPDGLGWYDLTRGQVLAFVDVRSWKIIAWSIQPERNYNSMVIRTLMNRVCASWGLPARWYFERGIWKNAKLVKGESPAGWNDGLSWPETQVGWEQVGVRFVHATRARSKPVERVFGLIQDRMESVRGYCGRDERRDCPEGTKRAMDDVKARRVSHPGELFLSFDEWETELGRIISEYNATSQDGEVLAGLSPNEAFETYWPNDNPPAKFDANCWHLVAHYVKQVPVTVNGICFRVGSKKYVYRNERTGQDRGKQVLAWFDPECPEYVCVTDLNRCNPYLVERSQKVDFIAEPGDANYAHQLELVAGHNAYPKARFHTVKAKFAPTFRRNLVDVTTAELAQEITTQRQRMETAQKAQTAQTNKARRAYSKLGMNIPSRMRPGAEDAAAELAQLMAQPDQNPKSDTAGKKTYILKPFTGNKSHE